MGQDPASVSSGIETTLYAPEDELVDNCALWWNYNEYRTKAIRVDMFNITYRNGVEISRSRIENWTYNTNDYDSCFLFAKTQINGIWGFTVSPLKFNNTTSIYSAEISIYYQGNTQGIIGLYLDSQK